MEVIAVEESAIAVVVAFDGRTDALRAFLRRRERETMILLAPEDDDARRLVHAASFDGGVPVHPVERPARVTGARALQDVASAAAHALRARWIVPLDLDQAFARHEPLAGRFAFDGDVLRRSPPPAPAEPGGDLRVVVRTTTLPGPAHKEHLALRLRPGLARSVLVPLHVPMYTSHIRLRFDGLGAALVEADALRAFRRAAPTREIDVSVLPAFVRVAGFAALPAPPLRALCADGALELIVDIARLWHDGVADALELRVAATPLDGAGALSSAALDRLSAAHRDPWSAASAVGALLEARANRFARRAGAGSPR
jgi:hypothetical protein